MKNDKKQILIRRIVASLLDVTLTFIASLFIYFIIVAPISEKTTDILVLQEKYNEKYEEYGIKIWNELENRYIDNKDAKEEDIKAFKEDKEVIELENKIATISNIETISSITLSLAIFYIVLPLISKNGKTIGKKALGLKIESLNNEPLKKTQVIIRGLSFVIIEFSLGLLTYGIIPLISLCLVIFSKKEISIHDRFSKTNVTLVPIYKKESIVKEEDDEYYDQIALEERRDLRVGGRKNDK